MSWDVLLVNSAVRLPIKHEDYISPILGSKAEVFSTFKRALPLVSFLDNKWGVLDNDDFSIEFDFGNSDSVIYVALHVHGNDKVIHTIEYICEQTGWRAYDTTTGNFIDYSQTSASGLQQWRDARDKVMNHVETQGGKATKDARVFVSDTRKRWWMFWK